MKGCACFPDPGDPRQGSRCGGCPARKRKQAPLPSASGAVPGAPDTTAKETK